MRQFKLMALAFIIGTAGLFAMHIAILDEPDVDEEYEAEILHDEAYGDADFYKKLQLENEMHSDIVYRSKNLNDATIADDNVGLENFVDHLNDNYINHLNDDILIEDINYNDIGRAECISL